MLAVIRSGLIGSQSSHQCAGRSMTPQGFDDHVVAEEYPLAFMCAPPLDVWDISSSQLYGESVATKQPPSSPALRLTANTKRLGTTSASTANRQKSVEIPPAMCAGTAPAFFTLCPPHYRREAHTRPASAKLSRDSAIRPVWSARSGRPHFHQPNRTALYEQTNAGCRTSASAEIGRIPDRP